MAAVSSGNRPPPTPPTLPPPPIPRASGLQQLKDLLLQEEKCRVLLRQKDDDDDDDEEEEEEETGTKEPESDIGPEMVTAFINELDYADRYWDLKQYLTDLPVIFSNVRDWNTDPILKDLPISYTSGTIFDAYLKEVTKSEKKFDLDEEDVWGCISSHMQQLVGELIVKQETERRNGLKRFKLEYLYGVKETYTAEEQSKSGVDCMFLPFQFEPQMDPNISRPIWELVLRARKNDYVMDTKPELELGKIKGSVSPYYFRHHIYQESPIKYMRNTVMLANVTPHTSMWDVEESLSSSGKMLFSDLESGRGRIRTIYVTFKDRRGAKRALRKKLLTVEGRVVKISKPQPASAPRKSNDVSDPVAQEAAARDKYERLREKFAELSRDVKDDVGLLAKFESNNVKDDVSCVERREAR